MKKVLVENWIPDECRAGFDFQIDCPDMEKWSYDEAEMRRLIADYDGLVVIKKTCRRETLDAAKKLQIVSACGAGYDNIDHEYAASLGIYAANAPEFVTEPTAEFAFTLTCTLSRNIREWDARVRRDKCCGSKLFEDLSVELIGKRVGIIGFGRIGRAYARRAAAFGMEIVYHDVFRADEDTEKSLGARFCDLETLIKTSDVISLHVPYTAENHHLFSERQFDMMKSDAILINCARGPIVSEQALIAALKDGKIRGAALDVFENEPEISEAARTCPNLILTPHVGPGTRGVQINGVRESLGNLREAFEGRVPKHAIHKDIKPRKL